MNKRKDMFKVSIFAITVILFLFAGAFLATYTHTQEKIASENRIDNGVDKVPVVDFESADRYSKTNNSVSEQEISQRLIKNERYNNLNVVRELPIDVEIKPKSANWINNVPAIPVNESDEIVLGIVKTSEAFLSNDKTGIYSEFLVAIERSLVPNYISQENQEVFVERAGGGVRFPLGRTQRIEVYRGQEMPQVGSRYIFFLKKMGEKDFFILTAYELANGRVKPLDTIKPYTKYENEDEINFTKKIKDKIEEVNKSKKGASSNEN